ncbi:MAG: hypothetical protein K1Y02_17765 [Candidatus Hydrogenedentes bacterium]|nr:hypothetical protein [Candidatus Hydrogenedentota bacterium]
MTESTGENEFLGTAPSRAWVRSLLFSLMILVCGAVIGSVGTAFVMQDRDDRPPRHRPENMAQYIADDMEQKYGLNPEQKQKIFAVMEEHSKQLAAIRAEVAPRVEAEFEAVRKSVETILTPEQAKAWVVEYEKMRGKWRPRGDAQAPKESHPEK